MSRIIVLLSFVWHNNMCPQNKYHVNIYTIYTTFSYESRLSTHDLMRVPSHSHRSDRPSTRVRFDFDSYLSTTADAFEERTGNVTRDDEFLRALRVEIFRRLRTKKKLN